NYLGGQLAARHLVEQGFRRIGIITGPLSWWEARQRKQGWKDALQASGLPCPEELVVSGDWYPSSGASGMEELLRRCPDLEAVFACNDPMAAGALQAARRSGRSIPGDLTVVGFDDVPEAAYFSPSLTTISQPLTDLGGLAVDLLNQVLASQQNSPETNIPDAIWVQPQLVIRESSIRAVVVP
ncbi:MAG: substrate-binding domain-containing protein, partial [Anaerolineaceae bacterium]|nr:substrate-binding domain-containing protein [Anaerolineaceae bacterium]